MVSGTKTEKSICRSALTTWLTKGDDVTSEMRTRSWLQGRTAEHRRLNVVLFSRPFATQVLTHDHIPVRVVPEIVTA